MKALPRTHADWRQSVRPVVLIGSLVGKRRLAALDSAGPALAVALGGQAIDIALNASLEASQVGCTFSLTTMSEYPRSHMQALLRRISRRWGKQSQLSRAKTAVLASVRHGSGGVWATAGAVGSITLIAVVSRRLLRRSGGSDGGGDHRVVQSPNESREAEAAAREAAAIGGSSPSHAGLVEPDRPASAQQHPVAEAGGGESEGQEQFEADLADATSPPDD